MHPETEKEFLKIRPWTSYGNLYQLESFRKFISTHFIDRRVLEEELEKSKEIYFGNTYQKVFQDLKERLLNRKQ